MQRRILQALSFVTRVLISVVLKTVLKTAITGLIFAISLLIALHYLGVPVPGPSELLQKFEGLTRLAKILS